MSDDERERIDRRTFIAAGVAAGGALGALAAAADAAKKRAPGPPRAGAPNILVIMVDQLRYPQGFQTTSAAAGLMPNLARLRAGGVSFAHHYTAAND